MLSSAAETPAALSCSAILMITILWNFTHINFHSHISSTHYARPSATCLPVVGTWSTQYEHRTTTVPLTFSINSTRGSTVSAGLQPPADQRAIAPTPGWSLKGLTSYAALLSQIPTNHTQPLQLMRHNILETYIYQ